MAILDHRTRDSHKKMHGTLLSRWHNFWKLNYPPNGWNCRCLVNAYTRAEAKAKGWEETEDEFLPQGGIADKDWRYDTRNLEGEWAELDRVYLNKANRIIQGAHPSIKDHIQKGLREIEEERRTYGELKGACEELKSVWLRLKSTPSAPIGKHAEIPQKNIEIVDIDDRIRASLIASIPPDKKMAIEAKKILLSHETIFTHFHHEEIEAIDYFMVRFHDRAYHIEPAGDKEEEVKGRPYHAVYFYKEGYFYKAVLKVTKDGKEVYLVSLTRGIGGKKFKAEHYTPIKRRR